MSVLVRIISEKKIIWWRKEHLRHGTVTLNVIFRSEFWLIDLRRGLTYTHQFKKFSLPGLWLCPLLIQWTPDIFILYLQWRSFTWNLSSLAKHVLVAIVKRHEVANNLIYFHICVKKSSVSTFPSFPIPMYNKNYRAVFTQT